jgi:transposase
MARPGHERFTAPTLAAQRRYEALRAWWVEELSAAEIAERFGYTSASVQTLISTYREADLAELFASSRPGPKRQPKKDAARERVIEQATLILTNQKLTAKQLIERYGQRWGIENQLAEQIRAFHLDSLCSQVPLAVDFDVALNILADIVYRRFARGLHAAYHKQTPDTIRKYLINGIGELRFTPNNVEVRLRRRTHTPALLDAGYEQQQIQVPWWDGRTLSYSFPAR